MNPNYGDSIEDYEVLDLLGKGGFATVFRARSKKNNQEVAIKKIDRKLMQARNMVSRVKNEIMVHHQLKHPSVLELHNFFEDENYVYLVLELCHNGALNKFLKTKQKKLREADAGRLFRQVVEGLLYLHSHMIMHRDLSLSNILLTKAMDAKIADFGLSIQLKAEDEKHYTMCGTANYIAPEVAERGPHGLESDVWSLGCMLYTMVVGQPPFDTEGLTNTLMRVVSAEFKLPRELSLEAKNIISAMLRKNPSDRLKLSEILSHPFMIKQCRSYETQLYPRQALTSRAMVTNSLGSIDSGHGTQCTVSTSNHTSSSRHGPMRATVVPRGVTQYAPSPLYPVSNPRSTGTPSVCSHSHSDTSHSHDVSDMETWQQQGGFLCRRANSLEALGEGDAEDSRAWSYHSDPPPGMHGSRGRRHSHSNKENQPVPKIALDVRSQGTRRPLQDTTNRHGSWTSGHGTPTKDKPCVEKQQQSGSLKELVPPLNAARLRPVVQHKQNAVISISDSGKVWIKLLNHRGHTPSELRPNRTGSTSSLSGDGEIIQISPNGMEIELFRSLSATHSRHTASPEHNGFYLHACYTYHDLPGRYWKKYQYASQFVGLLRSRTAKVTLYTDQAKCVLMENAPNPDYEANFYNGVKIHQSANTTRFIEQDGHTYSVEGGVDIPQAMVPLYEHSQENLQKCREIEEAMTSLEKQGGGGTYFPVMAGRKRQTGGDKHRPSSAATSIASCVTSTSGGRSLQRRAISRSSSKENLSHSTLGQQRPRSSSVSSGRSRDRVGTDAVLRSVRVDGAGKAVQLASGVVLINYNDGSQLKLQSSSCASFKYTDPQGKEFMFDKKDKVPSIIKPKLDYLPKVMDHFLRQSQKQ